jgi:hypothetical protein
VSFDGIELRLQKSLAPLPINFPVPLLEPADPIVGDAPLLPASIDRRRGALAQARDSVLVEGSEGAPFVLRHAGGRPSPREHPGALKH